MPYDSSCFLRTTLHDLKRQERAYLADLEVLRRRRTRTADSRELQPALFSGTFCTARRQSWRDAAAAQKTSQSGYAGVKGCERRTPYRFSSGRCITFSESRTRRSKTSSRGICCENQEPIEVGVSIPELGKSSVQQWSETHRSGDGVDIDHKLAVEDRVRVVELFAILMREGEPIDLVHVILAIDLYVASARKRKTAFLGQQRLLRSCATMSILFPRERTR